MSTADTLDKYFNIIIYTALIFVGITSFLNSEFEKAVLALIAIFFLLRGDYLSFQLRQLKQEGELSEEKKVKNNLDNKWLKCGECGYLYKGSKKRMEKHLVKQHPEKVFSDETELKVEILGQQNNIEAGDLK